MLGLMKRKIEKGKGDDIEDKKVSEEDEKKEDEMS